MYNLIYIALDIYAKTVNVEKNEEVIWDEKNEIYLYFCGFFLLNLEMSCDRIYTEE